MKPSKLEVELFIETLKEGAQTELSPGMKTSNFIKTNKFTLTWIIEATKIEDVLFAGVDPAAEEGEKESWQLHGMDGKPIGDPMIIGPRKSEETKTPDIFDVLGEERPKVQPATLVFNKNPELPPEFREPQPLTIKKRTRKGRPTAGILGSKAMRDQQEFYCNNAWCRRKGQKFKRGEMIEVGILLACEEICAADLRMSGMD